MNSVRKKRRMNCGVLGGFYADAVDFKEYHRRCPGNALVAVCEGLVFSKRSQECAGRLEEARILECPTPCLHGLTGRAFESGASHKMMHAAC